MGSVTQDKDPTNPPDWQVLLSAYAPLVLYGVVCAAGWVLPAGNRDPAQFENPDRVDLHRGSPKHHLAFGHGIHFCVGAALARIEARAVLTTLLQQTRDFSLDPDRHPQWVDSLLVRRHAQLHVTATPR